MRTLMTMIAVGLAQVGSSQIQFVPAENNVGEGFRSGSPVLSIDINNDGLDDLVRLDKGTILCIDLSKGDGEFVQVYREEIATNEQWNLVAADVNQDGFADVITSGVSDRVKVLLNNGAGTDFLRTVIDDERFFAQTSNVADVNNDGFMDIFVCDDDAANKLYTGDGSGAFTRNDTLIDFNTVPPSDNSGNYGSIWTDFDLDGDLDLYISKCRIGVFETTDPRRINMLYERTDTGYVESAAKYGLASGAQSWCADFADADNDGDFDVVVINHDVPADFYENGDTDTLTDITEASGIDVSGVIIQSIFRDFDNDGLQDLFVSGSIPKLYHNKGGLRFEEVENPFPGGTVSSFTIGDFNADGFPDIYATYNELYNTPSDKDDDKLWLNVPNDNNHVSIKLVGSDLNYQAVGAKLFLHGEWGTQIREIRAGESYGIGTSLIQNIGVGQSTSVDSLVVVWPDGLRETHLDIPLNTLTNVTKGGCATQVVSLGQGPFTVCDKDDSFTLNAPNTYSSYLWSTGETTSEITVTDPGFYLVTLTNDQGCQFLSYPIIVQENLEPDSVQIEVIGRDVKCFGEGIQLIAPDGESYTWSDGQNTQSIEVTESGEYGVTVTRVCTDANPEPVLVTLLDPAQLPTLGDTVLPGQMGVLFAEGDSVLWFNEEASTDPFASGNSIEVEGSEVDTVIMFQAQQFSVLAGESLTAGIPNHIGPDKYNGDSFNGGVSFDAFGTFRLDSVKVFTEFEGVRKIVLKDSVDVVVDSITVLVDSGITFISLMFDITPGNGYLLTTDEEQNFETFGFESPRLYRSTEGVDFPYATPEVLTINGAEFGPGRYYYFFDWHLTTRDQLCVGERNEVLLVVRDTSTSVEDFQIIDIQGYPNPVSDRLNVQGWDYKLTGQSSYYVIRKLDGREVRNGEFTENAAIDVSELVSGTYLLELTTEGLVGLLKFIKL